MSTPDMQKEPKARKAAPEVGSKAWFWRMRSAHWVLWVAPVFPLLDAFLVAQRGALTNRGEKYGSSFVGEGYLRSDVLMHGAFWEHLLLAVPGTVMAAVVGFICYSLWRIRVNMGAEGKIFTIKDQKTLEKTPGVLLLGLVVAVLSAILIPAFLPSAAVFTAPFVEMAGLMVTVFLSFSVVLMAFADVYRLARLDREKLEEIA